MVSPERFSRAGRLYLWCVIAWGIVILGLSIAEFTSGPIPRGWFILAGLTLVSGSATLQLPSSYASISISETFVFAAALLYGPAAATVTVAIDALTISFWIAKRHRHEPHRALFNMSAPVISAWLSAHVFFAVSRIAPLAQSPASINSILPPLFLFALIYFTLNSWLVTFVIALERNLNPFEVWRSSFAWLSLNYFGGASVAILFVGFTRTIDIGYVGIILPLLIVLYFTFRTTMGRVNDANKHLEQLNKLYMSTIETLAMAIDAKDQVTHGHIRRVQLHAIQLAKAVGVNDPNLIKAIEAAALLHDMGKLAVPEYILNKPGKLTHSEFDRMKLHASIGADILSAIDFPYPVVPIVRHHHENWDGSGYPDGLRRTEIPIGARILAVVDCFDALTSDRPYRPRLSDAEALKILFERRGSMYDPLVVDTFARVHAEAVPIGSDPTATGNALRTIGNTRIAPEPSTNGQRLDEIVSSSDEMLTLFELVRSLAGQTSLSDACNIIANHLRRLVPFSVCVFYMTDARTSEIEARHVIGEDADTIKGLRLPLGQRLSGWVAAHHQAIVNSDPTLDFGELNRSRVHVLKSCISAPLMADGEDVVGVITMYSTHPGAFTDDHKRIIESVGKQIAHTLRAATGDHGNNVVTNAIDLPTASQLEAIVRTATSTSAQPFSILLIDIENVRSTVACFGEAVAENAVCYVIQQIQRNLRASDLLFSNSSNELVAVLRSTDVDAARAVARTVELAVTGNSCLLPSGDAVPIRVRVGVATATDAGATLTSLLLTARNDSTPRRASEVRVH